MFTTAEVRNLAVDGRQLRIAVRPARRGFPGPGVVARRTPLLLINGIGASLELLEPFVRALDPACEVIRFDPPGVGGSAEPSGPYRFTGLCALIASMLTELGVDVVDVLGISWGGAVAQHFAAFQRARCRRLVLVSTATGSLMVPARPSVLAHMVTPRRYLDRAFMERVAGSIYGGSAREDPERIAAAMNNGNRVGPSRGYLYQLTAGAGWTSVPFLPLLRQRTLILSGDDDPIIPLANARLMKLLIPKARLHVFHGGHLGLVSEATELAPIVDAFLTAPLPVLEVFSMASSGRTALTDGDFYLIEQALDTEGRQLLLRVREFMEKSVQPVINHYWTREEFPFDLMGDFRQLGIAGQLYQGYGCPGGGFLLDGMIAMELARVDPSIATFFGVHGGLAMGSIYLCGSEEQKQRWLPEMARMEKIGAFGLTEPDVGSGAAGGLTTTARRDGSEWVLDGQKKWIGNATFADYVIIWARSLEDDQVKGFVVAGDTPGFETSKQKDKIALRVVQNAHITLDGVRVPEENRLQQANSFKDTAKVLRMTRAGVAWMATGCARGAYEHALAYARQRQQFGRPIAGFQLVQDLLVRMLANVTSSACLCARLAALQEEGLAEDHHSALAKAFCTVRMREATGWARELLGGNGILLENHVGRFVADSEAIYSYEGTREINTLIVGRAITGTSAFV
jgi:glutaryl-CoA dehydrogenase